MPTITFSHKKLKFSLAAVLILLFAVVSFSFGTVYAKRIIFSEPTAVGENRQVEKSAPSTSVFASIYSIFYRAAADDAVVSSVITVNDNGDSTDLTPGNGACADAAGKCTLRAAIQEANALAGVDSINFSFPDSDPKTIQLNPNISPKELQITEAVTITGPGARLLTISGNTAATTADIFSIAATATLTTKISGITIQKSGRYGINNSGKLELSDVAIKDCLDAGIFNTAKLMVNRALINNNANGGIRLTSTSNAVNISNTTITVNSSKDNGGGINTASGDVTLNNVTISHNFAQTNGGGLYYSGQSAGVNVRNTIIANNTPANGPDVFATAGVNFNSRGNNLIGKNSGSNGFTTNPNNGDKVGTIAVPLDPKLGALQNNGGQTDTRALDNGSPARDTGSTCVQNLTCTQNTNPAVALNTDQRGAEMPRFFENGVDMGAFETYFPQASITSLSPSNWGTGRGAFELVVNGSNFVAGSQVKWNGQNRITTFVSNNQIKANILASDVATAGSNQVRVDNPAPNPGQSETVTFTVANCAYSLSQPSMAFPVQGGTRTVDLTTYGGCQWNATTDVSWITFNNGSPSASGTGSATITFTVQPNTGASRTGLITIGGQTLTVTQPSGCTFSLSPVTTRTFSSAAQSDSVFLTASDPSCSWNVTKDQTWITVTPTSGSGTKTLIYSVTANTGAARNGTFTVGGQTFTINQDGNCSFTLTPTEQTFSATGGTGTFTVSTGSGCLWAPAPNVNWITATSSGGTVSFNVQPNIGTQIRTGKIAVGDTFFTVTQNPPCDYTITPPTGPNIPGAGGNGSFTLTTAAGCNWTATADSWITVTSPSGTGTRTVNYSAAPNTGTTPRTGTITIAGKTHTFTQEAGCNFSFNTNSVTIPAQGGNTNSVALTTQSGCAWTAQVSPNTPWLSLNTGSGSGTGSKTIFFTVLQNTGPERTGTITIGNATLTITQLSGCSFNLNPTSASVLQGAGNYTVELAANNSACAWSAATTTSWIAVDSTTASGTGAKTIKYSVLANTGPERTGTITIGGIAFNVTQASGCTYNLSSTSADFAATGGNGSVSLTVNTPGCGWLAFSNDPTWLKITSSGSGTNNTTVTFTVDPNTGAARTGTLNIGGQTFTVRQAIGCSFSLPPTLTIPSGAANNLSFNLTVNNPACTWTASTTTPWISINSDSQSGSGSKAINFTVQANTGPERTGSITITGNGQTLTFNIIQQTGCTYALSAPGASFPREGGSGSFNLTTNNQLCTWSATVSSNATAWLSINGSSSGTGNATINFTVAENVVPARSGTITINGQTYTVTQSNGCRFTLSAPSVSVSAAAGNASFNVNSGAGCTWTAASNHPWITITSGGNGSSANPAVSFSFTANPGPLRTGTITITGVNGQTGGQVLTFTVNQANGCNFVLSPTSFPDIPSAGASRTVTVTASDPQCTWSASVEGNATWITITNSTSQTGSGTLNFDVAANNGLARNGTLKIANQTVTITQINGCTYTLTPATMSIDELGGQRSFNITVSNSACTWTATKDVPWLTITSNASGTGNGTITFTVQPNSDSTQDRVGKINVGGEVAANRRDFTIIQVSLTVRNLNDSGSGSLRQAVINANNSASNDIITFVPNLSGTISLSSGEIKIGNSFTSGTLEIRGPGANVLTVSGGGISRVFYLDNAVATIKGLTISGGNGVGDRSEFSRKVGGAVCVYRGSAAFSGVNITGNDIMGEPGQGMQNLGGGIYIEDGNNHLIENSTISGNSSTNGGGLFFFAGFDVQGLRLYNTTIAGNTAMADGGGVYAGGNAFVRNATIVNNSVTSANGTGAGLGIYTGTIEIGNTIIAENRGPEITLYNGTPISIGNNLFGDAPGDAENTGIPFPYNSTDKLNVPPLISILWQLGGTMPTVALMSGSPAIDGGKNENGPSSLQTDQRGVPRILGARIDIGAFENNINVTPVNQILPAGAVNEFYVGQQIRGARINAGTNPEQFGFELMDGELPPGMLMQPSGFITGMPTFAGTFRFVIKVTGLADGTAGVNKYTINVGCAVSLSRQTQAVNANGDSFSFNVNAPQGCGWTAATSENWITLVQPTSGNGNGAVTFNVAANNGPARTGTIRVGTATLTVTQAGATNCTYSIPAPNNATHTATGGNGSFGITTQVGCPWEAASDKNWVTFPSNNATGTGSGNVSYTVAANSTGSGRTATITVGGQTFTVNQTAFAAPTAFDFDGDGKADFAVFRPSAASWYMLKSRDSGFEGLQFGFATDKLVPADYDGDGKTDVAVFREGAWYYNRSIDGEFKSFGWGVATDIPVPGDYDGDRKADFAVFRDGNWYIYQSSNSQFRAEQFGLATDKPVPADYDGDGKTDIAVFRDGNWYWLKSSNNTFTGMQFGIAGDKPVVGDYDGDGKADPAVIRGAIWYFQKTTDGFSGLQFGVVTDLPTPADYDGDGKTDVAVFREGAWYYNRSIDGKFVGINWGVATDKPIQGAFIP